MLLLRPNKGSAGAATEVAAAADVVVGPLDAGAGKVGDDSGEVGDDGETIILISDFAREYPLWLLSSADAEADTDGRSGIGWWWPSYLYFVTHSYSVILVPSTRVWIRRYTRNALMANTRT